MEVILNFLSIVFFIIFSFAAIRKLVDFITGWSKKQYYKQLYSLSFIVWFIIFGLYFLLRL